MSGALALARRWVNDYFNRHDAAAARQFCALKYTLNIGDVVLSGRDDAWLPAVDQQFKAWPGMGMTVHRTACGDDWAAVWFSEHGASGGKAAAWSGVAIYHAAGGLLQGCVAQEDYFTRRRQVKDGTTDPVDPPCAAPWDTQPLLPDPGAEAVVRDWLASGWPKHGAAVPCDDDLITGCPLEFAVESTETAMFRVSGADVAFHIRQRGTYRAGLPVPGPAPATLDVNGLVTVQGGQVVAGRVIRDRMGLWNRLRAAA